MLEQIVRPFQFNAAIPDKAFVVTRPVVATPELAIITWGGPGQAPTIAGLGFKIKGTDKRLRETSRTTHDVRITNPDDDTQFVMEQRIDKIHFSEKPVLITPSTSGDTGGNNSGESAGAPTSTAFAAPPHTNFVNNPTVNTSVPNPTGEVNSEFTLVQGGT